MSAPGSGLTDAGELVLRLSRQMREAAREGGWERLAELHAQREPVLRALCEGRLLARDRLREVLEQVLELDRETVARVLAARDEAQMALRHLGRGREAVAAYAGPLR